MEGENNVEHMWEQVKWAMFESAREVCRLVRVGGGNPKCVVERLGESCSYEKEVCLVRGTKMQKKGIWKSTKWKRERLKGTFIKGRRSKNSLEGR